MTDAVRKMLMSKASEDYLKKVEERKKKDKELEEEVKRLKSEAINKGEV